MDRKIQPPFNLGLAKSFVWAVKCEEDKVVKIFNKISVIVLVVAFTLGLVGLVIAATAVSLGTADSFAILAGSGITNTGPTTITGDVGTHPTTDETGFASITLNGTNHAGDSVTQGAKTDLITAYNDAAGQGPATTITSDLGTFLGGTLSPGVYNSGSSIGLTGTVTLNGGGDPNAVFIFQAGSTLTTANSSKVVLTGSAQACNVFWQVGSSATLGTYSTFKGNILALTSATLTTGANVEGRVLARNGAVTLDSNIIAKATCGASSPATLRVVKSVTNDDGGTATATLFNLHVKLSGTDVTGSPAVGTGSPGTAYSLTAGTYTVSEDAYSGYSFSFSGDCDANGSITLTSGDDRTCTVTNNDIASGYAVLHVVKHVVNDDSGRSTASHFTLRVKLSGTEVAGSPAGGVESPGTAYSLAAGSYTVSEDAYGGYSSSFSGDCDANGAVTLASGDNKTCTITNDLLPVAASAPANPPQALLRIVKRVINNNGGSASAAFFKIHVKSSGIDVATSPTFGRGSPGTLFTLNPNTYTVSEDAYGGYSSSFSGACDANGNISLASGDDKTCTVTNDDNPSGKAYVGASVSPKLPNTGFIPRKSNNIPGHAPIGVFLGIFILLVLILTKRRFSSRP